MGAGPTKEQIASGTRKALQAAAKLFRGTYIPARGKEAAFVQVVSSWRLDQRLIRASNGEAALLFQATRLVDQRKSDWVISYSDALAHIGIFEGPVAVVSPVWTEAKYPGDAVRIELLRRGDEIGDIRIQDYNERLTQAYRVAAFLPGVDVCLPGDTPKTEPDKHQWDLSKREADAHFDRFLAEAHRDGWVHYDRNKP